MIFKEEKLVETESNITDDEIKIIVDPKESSKLLSILLDSYKNARAAILREYTSNAWDAHKEIGSDKPVVITIDEDDGGTYLEFQDKGVGMTDVFIKRTFSQLLKSTKSSSNDQIGMFGIGSKCALAYENQFTIKTIKDGRRNEYLISREGNGSPVITPMLSERTTDHSGTNVRIYLNEEKVEIKEDTWRTIRMHQDELFADIASKELSFFDNVIFNFKTINTRKYNINYNNGKILEGQYFKFRSSSQYSDEFHIILGKVCYQIDWKEIGLVAIKIPIGVKFDLGEIMVNMTREMIIYSDETKKLIRERLLLAKKELIDEFNKKQVPIDNIFEYIKKNIELRENEKYYLEYLIPNQMEGGLHDLYKIDITNISKEEIYGKDNKYNLNPLVFKPIQHLPIKVDRKVDLTFFITLHSNHVIEGKHKKNIQLDLLKLYNNQQIKVYKNGVLPDSKEFRKYNQNCVFLKEESIGYHEKAKLTKTLQYLGINPETTEFFGKTKQAYLLGISKIIFEYKKIIREELYKALNVIDYKTFKIPDEWKKEQKLLYKKTVIDRPKLEGIIPYRDIINDYQSELNLKTMINYTGIIIYGFLKDKELFEPTKTLLNINNSFKKQREVTYGSKTVKKNSKSLKINNTAVVYNNLQHKAIELIRIAETNEKLLKKLHNVIHIKNFIMSNTRVLNRIMTGFEIDEKYSLLIENDEALCQIASINRYIYTKLAELKTYYNKFNKENLSSFQYKYPELYDELKELKEKNKGIPQFEFDDLSIRPTINIIDDYFKGCELLFNIEYDQTDNELTSQLVEFVKLKGKRVNVEYYKNSNKIQQIQPKEPENTFNGWGVECKLVESKPSNLLEYVDEEAIVLMSKPLSGTKFIEDIIGLEPLPDEYYNELQELEELINNN